MKIRIVFATILAATTALIGQVASLVTDSAQCHWSVNGVLAHTHVDIEHPRYDNVKGEVIYKAIFTLFHTSGFIGLVNSELGYILWEDGQYDPYRRIQGNPNGVVVVTAKYVLSPLAFRDPNVNEGPRAFVDHGWATPRLLARTFFPDGSRTDTSLFIPVYSILNPSAPEVIPAPGADKLLRGQCEPGDGTNWGALVSEYHTQTLPLSPITSTYAMQFFGYNYGGFQTGGSVDRRLDPDLHNGIVGTQLNDLSAFNLSEIPNGTHRISNIWHQVVNGREAASLLVHSISVGTVVEPPPPPPPNPTWQIFNGIFQRLNDLIRICDPTDNKCSDPIGIH